MEERILDALKSGRVLELQELLNTGALNVNQKYKGDTWLAVAVRAEKLPSVRFLLENGADPNSPDKNGFAPIFLTQLLPILRELVEKGANPNYTLNIANARGWTPLHMLAQFKDVDKLQALIFLAKHANVNARAEHGDTPLHIASQFRRVLSAGKVLLKRGARVDLPGFRGATPLLTSADNPFALKLLLQYGKDAVNIPDNHGATALHYAALRGNLESVQLLLEAGADPNLRDTRGNTPLNFAATREIQDLLRGSAPPPPPPPTVLYKGYTKTDAELFNQMFEEPNEWSCCPVCLAYVRRSDGCMYMHHPCKPEERHEALFQKFKDTRYKAGGEIEWCTICGRITYSHQHYQLSRATDPKKPDFAPISREAPGGVDRHFDSDCKRVGGGGFEEKVRRTHRLLGYACELQSEVGKIPETQARNELVEEMWNAGDMRNRKVATMIEGKKFEFPCTFPEDAKPVVEEAKEFPDIPRPADQEELKPIEHVAPENDCVVEMGPHDDGRPTYEFRHKQADGTIVNHVHVCAPDLEAIIRAQPIDGLCRIEPDKCKALLYPEELYDIATPEFYEVYRKRFNEANAKQGGGAGGLMRPLDMDTATCAPPQKAARRRKTRRKGKGRRKTRKA